MRPVEQFPNLVSLFLDRARELGDAPFLFRKTGGTWVPLSWAEVARQVRSLAQGLRLQGVQPGDRVALVSENRPEFCIADLAIMAVGAVTVPTYTTNTTRDHEHVLVDSGATAAIVSTAKLARVLLPALLRSNVRLLVSVEELGEQQSGTLAFAHWADLVAGAGDGAPLPGEAATRDDLACIIYTSGTGGAPRGVMQHHGAIMHNVEGCIDIIVNDFPPSDDIFLSFLPLSHAYEHSGGQFLPIGMGAQIYYAEGLDKLAANIEEVRPTIMIVVPRLFEVLRARILKAIGGQGRIANLLLGQAMRVGRNQVEERFAPWDAPVRALLARTLVPRVRARFGGRIKALVSGGAPLNPDVGTFFHGLGLTLLQGYGQTEAGPVISVSRPGAGVRMDCVGPPILNTQVRIAEDGEILVRGALVMKGYWRNPAETERVLRDGWLHTGDIGEIDAKGRIRITDRKKDLIVNDKGENVSPQRVEGMLTLQEEIGQAMVTGDKRPWLVGLLVPDAEWLKAWAAARGLAPDLTALTENTELHADLHGALRAAVDRVNRDLTVTEKVRSFALADAPFTVENEMLTPSMKIRRHAIRAVYQPRLDALYRD